MFSSHPLYLEDVQLTAGLNLRWDLVKDSTLLISGASGLLGTFIVDAMPATRTL